MNEGKIKMMIYREWTLLFLAASFGFLAVVAPVFFNHSIKHYDAPLFPLVATAIEGLGIYALLFLFLVGFFLSLVGQVAFWKIGLATMVVFPILATIEMIVADWGHNLWPIEFFIYGVLCIPGAVGALIGKTIRRVTDKKKIKPEGNQ